MRHQTPILATAAALILAPPATGSLIISEVVDATLTGGLPKFVEITNVGDVAIDLSTYSIGNFNNGGTTLGGGVSTQLPAFSLPPRNSFVISYENGDEPGLGVFFDTYGFDPDFFDLGAFTNGDDVYALFQGNATGDGSDATIVDLVGVIGVDGTGEPWEYTDSYLFRNPDVLAPNATWTESEWTIAGADFLDGADAPTIAANTTPGSHDFVPEPSAAALLLAGLAGLAFRRRR